MKELSSIATNNLALLMGKDEGIIPSVEVALIITELTYSLSNDGALIRSRSVETVRFAMGVEGLRKLAKKLNTTADELHEDYLESLQKAADKDLPVKI